MISKLKLHFNEGCINVIANERVYWSDDNFTPLKGQTVIGHLDPPQRYIYTKKSRMYSI